MGFVLSFFLEFILVGYFGKERRKEVFFFFNTIVRLFFFNYKNEGLRDEYFFLDMIF